MIIMYSGTCLRSLAVNRYRIKPVLTIICTLDVEVQALIFVDEVISRLDTGRYSTVSYVRYPRLWPSASLLQHSTFPALS